MFTVAGLSRQNGSLKLRFANDFVTRCKVLARNGHKDINLIELPQAMTKDAAAAYISTLSQFAYVEAQAAISQFASEKSSKTVTLSSIVKKVNKKFVAAKTTKEVPAEQLLAEAGLVVADLKAPSTKNKQSAAELA